MTQCWRLDSSRQTLVFSSQQQQLPECIYWGVVLPEEESLPFLDLNRQYPIGGGALDQTAPLSICPESSSGFMGQPGIQLSNLEGKILSTHFKLQAVKQTSPNQICFESLDAKIGLSLIHSLALDPDKEVLTARSELILQGGVLRALRVDWLAAPVIPVASHLIRQLDFSGRWCSEFQAQEHHWALGARIRESREGRTGHAHVPVLFCGEPPLKNTTGEVCAWHLGWSGGHRMVAEELTDGRRQVQFGALNHPVVLDVQNPNLKTPPLYLSYSPNGLNEVMQSFHQLARQQIIRFASSQTTRPVHYNSWEAVYFHHDLDTLKTIATQAAELGAERFVLDDGWFRGRYHDQAALGDWQIDQAKYPTGLHPLIAHVQQQGMQFGLWVEPEMINPDSDLYRSHPDWVLGDPALLGRHQLVLDLSQAEVTEYLFQCLNSLLSEYDISYLKWDHNRVCIEAGQSQTLALYDLLKRLHQEHPQVEIESCASGGGRIDFGILEHTQRVWLSDSNDAMERWRIQHHAALLLTPEVTGSHVGPRQCHTSGRVLPMGFRAWVAASRHMGFEMDPRELDQEEQQTLKAVTQWWKANRDWLFAGRLYRLDSDDESVMAEMTVSREGRRLLVLVAQMTTSARSTSRLLRLTGLAAHSFYRLKLNNPEAIVKTQNRFWRSPLNTTKGLVLSGQSLMQQGISLPIAFPATLWVIEGECINPDNNE